MDRYIRCLDCARFLRSATSPEAGLGRCPSARLAWNGHPGQWPRKQHPCAAFVPMENHRGEDSPRYRRPEGLPESRSETPGAESAAPGQPGSNYLRFTPEKSQPPTAGTGTERVLQGDAAGPAPAFTDSDTSATGQGVPTGSVPGAGAEKKRRVDADLLSNDPPKTNPNPADGRNGAAAGPFPEVS